MGEKVGRGRATGGILLKKPGEGVISRRAIGRGTAWGEQVMRSGPGAGWMETAKLGLCVMAGCWFART